MYNSKLAVADRFREPDARIRSAAEKSDTSFGLSRWPIA
jgi:hypothetical protein